MSKEIELELIKYESDFTKRSKDLKKPYWFSFPNDLLLHPDFTDINGEELKWFIWCLSVCSKINNSKIRLNISHAVKFLSLSEKNLFSMLEKLKGKQILTIDAAASRPHHDREPTATLQYTTNKTLQTIQDTTNIISSEPENLVPDVIVNKVSINISNNHKATVKQELIESWADTYDAEFLKQSMKEMRNWILANTHKAPKSDWSRFMNSWFKRGWEQYRKTLGSNKPSKISQDDLSAWINGD